MKMRSLSLTRAKARESNPVNYTGYLNRKSIVLNPDNKGEVTLTPVILGELLVLHTENTTATVMITDSRKAIHAGAKIITPFKLEPE